jgi:phosphatidylglycerophosphate synthase
MSYLKKYIKEYKKSFEVNSYKIAVKKYPLVHIFLSLLANFFIPFFIKFKIHQNQVSVINLLLTLFSIFIILSNNTYSYYALFFFPIYHFIDHIDGGIARSTSTKTFYGKFLDSYIDSFFNVFFKLTTVTYCFYFLKDDKLFIFNIFSITFIAFDVFILDKFSAITRWCNLENNTNFNPYIRKNKSSFINFLIEDIIFVIMITIPFILTKFYILKKILILLSILFIILGIYNILLHFKFAKETLRKNKI